LNVRTYDLEVSWRERLARIDWANHRTAYGAATDVPGQLLRLVGKDTQDALDASHELWCGLCHQHAYVSSAALPALPFLLELLAVAEENLAAEILDILLGFARCTTPRRGEVPSEWEVELRAALQLERTRFLTLTQHAHPEVSGFADAIVEALDTPLLG